MGFFDIFKTNKKNLQKPDFSNKSDKGMIIPQDFITKIMGGRKSISYDGDVDYVIKNFVITFYENEEFKKDTNIRYLLSFFRNISYKTFFDEKSLIHRIENEKMQIDYDRAKQQELLAYQKTIHEIRPFIYHNLISPYIVTLQLKNFDIEKRYNNFEVYLPDLYHIKNSNDFPSSIEIDMAKKIYLVYINQIDVVENFLHSKKYDLLKNFVKIYKNNLTSIKIDQLCASLLKFGFSFENDTLLFIIDREVILQQIHYQGTESTKELMIKFAQEYENIDFHTLFIFHSILVNRGYSNSIDYLIKELDGIKVDLLTISISQKSKKIISLDDIDQMDGVQFENYLKNLYEKIGYRVKNTPTTGDQGADLILQGFGERIIVQAKCYANSKVGNEAIQQVVAALPYYNAEKAIVITNSHFTNSAILLAHSNNVELIDREKLSKLISKTNHFHSNIFE